MNLNQAWQLVGKSVTFQGERGEVLAVECGFVTIALDSGYTVSVAVEEFCIDKK